jgi:hypothetical protein
MDHMKHKYSVEKLYHFRCFACAQWFTIADCTQFHHIFCPWCGNEADAVPDPKHPEKTDNKELLDALWMAYNLLKIPKKQIDMQPYKAIRWMLQRYGKIKEE